MNTENPGNNFRKILISTVAVAGLMEVMAAPYARAQIGFNIGGMVDSRGDFGGRTGIYIPLNPLSALNAGTPYVSVEGGVLAGRLQGQALLGYRQGFGNFGIGGYAGVGLQESAHHNRFVETIVGGEVIYGGWGLQLSGYIPVGHTRQQSQKRQTQGVLLDPSQGRPGSCDPTTTQCTPPVTPTSCSSPQPGAPKVCEIGVAVTDARYEKAKAGFEVGLSYQMDGAGWALRPSLGYGRFGQKEQVNAGLAITLGLTDQLLLTAESGATHRLSGGRLQGYVGLGLTYQFGGVPFHQQTALQRQFNQAPRHINYDDVQIQQQGGRTTIYRPQSDGQMFGIVPKDYAPIWDQTGKIVTEVWFVDKSTQNQAISIVTGAKVQAMVVFDGDVTVADSIKLSQAYQGMVGGSSVLKFHSNYWGDMTLTLPGSKGKVMETSASKAAFVADGVEHPVFYGLGIEGGVNNVRIVNADRTRLVNMHGNLAVQDGFYFQGSSDVSLYQVSSDNAGGDGFKFITSSHPMLENVTNNNAKKHGFEFYISSSAELKNVSSIGAGINGFTFILSNYSNLDGVRSMGALSDGLYFAFSDHASLNHILSVNNQGKVFDDMGYGLKYKGAGLELNGSNHVRIENIFLNNATDELSVASSNHVTLTNAISYGSVQFFESNQAYLAGVDVMGGNLIFEKSDDAWLYATTVRLLGASGGNLSFSQSDNIFVSGATLDTGLRLNQSRNVHLDHLETGSVNVSAVNGLVMDQVSIRGGLNVTASHAGKFSNITIIDGWAGDIWAGGHIKITRSDGIALDNISIVASLGDGYGAVELEKSGSFGKEISFHNVSVVDKNIAYDRRTIAFYFNDGYERKDYNYVKDLGGNTALNVRFVCDGIPLSYGSVNVLNLKTGKVEQCR